MFNHFSNYNISQETREFSVSFLEKTVIIFGAIILITGGLMGLKLKSLDSSDLNMSEIRLQHFLSNGEKNGSEKP